MKKMNDMQKQLESSVRMLGNVLNACLFRVNENWKNYQINDR